VDNFCKKPELHSAIWENMYKHKVDKEYYIKKAVIWLESSIQKKRKKKFNILFPKILLF